MYTPIFGAEWCFEATPSLSLPSSAEDASGICLCLLLLGPFALAEGGGCRNDGSPAISISNGGENEEAGETPPAVVKLLAAEN